MIDSTELVDCLDSYKDVDKSEMRDKISMFSDIMAKHPDTKVGNMDECPLKHTFADGVYVREIFIPKDYLLVGKIHKHSHPNFLMSGKVIVVTEGAGTETLEAPMSIISPPGTKRIVHALEDTVWITVHVTKETDLDKIEDYVIAKSYDEFLEYESKKQIEVNKEIISEGILCHG